MSYNAAETLGHFEALILTAITRLGPDMAYGMNIHSTVEDISGRTIVSLGAVYTALDRLEKKGLVSSRFGEATPERGGRAKRFFKIEAAGEAALKRTIEEGNAMSAALKTARTIA